MPTLSAVVFDFDGVIFDSETPEYEAHRRMFERCGLSLGPDEWCDQIGLWADDQDERWFARLRAARGGPATLEDFRAEKRRLFTELVPRTPMPGILELLGALEHRGVPVAIASTSPARWVVSAAASLRLVERFQTIVTADDVRRRKPAPDVYLEAARRLGVPPGRTVALEDSAPGIAAARAAGMKTIAIPHWLTERHDLSAADLCVRQAGEVTVPVLERLVGESTGNASSAT